MEELDEQRRDDHRYYHQHRVTQSLHLFSACCFLATYALMFVNPIAAALLGWVVAMWSRQIGHFFFEPKGYDAVNGASHEEKERIKVGYNLTRKVMLFAVWAAIPLVLWVARDYPSRDAFLNTLGVAWLALAGAGLLARTLWLCATRNLQTGAVWFTKILTDPFNDIRQYWRAPYWLIVKGQLMDPEFAPRG